MKLSWVHFASFFAIFYIFCMMPCKVFACTPSLSCVPIDCELSEWSSWSNCTVKCGNSGVKERSRRELRHPDCDGKKCQGNLTESVSCPGSCCPIPCVYRWTMESSCSTTCGNGTKQFKLKIIRYPLCGGSPCPNKTRKTEQCGDGGCCPVNCAVGSWGSWGSCNAACEKTGTRKRNRQVTRQASCGGTSCPSLTDTKSCSGPCCPRDCVMSSWSTWSKCSSSGCAVNSGTRKRTRRLMTKASCGGTCGLATSDTQKCTPIPISCQVSSWSLWQACVPSNGRCGQGNQHRSRNITQQSYCSSPCPQINESRSCVHSCCPVNCQLSQWTTWSSCSSTCGKGKSDRTRSVRIQPSCGGRNCSILSESKDCIKYNDKDCVMGLWSSWSVCDNGCGHGTQRRYRKITHQSVCRGQKCGSIEESRNCTSYRNSRDCEVGEWSSWSKCDQLCAIGNKVRNRRITSNFQCQGRSCPHLKESMQCGLPNNGCQHKCNNGVCSCSAGYNLIGTKNCTAKDCGKLELSYCPSGTNHGTTCEHPVVSCPNNQTIFSTFCSILCPSYYAQKGANSITCTAAGTWSTTVGTYCRRINDPPSQIILSGSQSVPENSILRTLVGRLSSVDTNPRDLHNYSLISGGEGKFVLFDDELYTDFVFDYETMTTRYDLRIRSTDNGNPPMSMEKIIPVVIDDVNERPTSVQLSNHYISENSDVDTIVGILSTIDPDNSQTHSYTLINSASGRFKVKGNILKVAFSNRHCFKFGGYFCSLNFEVSRSHQVTLRSTDNGNPSLSHDVNLTINLTDVNDQPRGLVLSNNKVSENATVSEVIGKFSAEDEDSAQTLSYFLNDDDKGRFTVDQRGYLSLALSANFEQDTLRNITAVAKDNGVPVKMIVKSFTIQILKVNDRVVNLKFIDMNNQHSQSISVKENASISSVIGHFEVSDNETSQELSIHLDVNPFQAFSLSSSNCTDRNRTKCETKLVLQKKLDREITQGFQIYVRVKDNQNRSIITTFNVSIEDCNDRPYDITIAGGMETNIVENIQGALAGELLSSDQDLSQTHSYRLLNNSDVFEIRDDFLFLHNDTFLDFENKSQYIIKIQSTDNGQPPLTSLPQSLIVHVINRNEAPIRIDLTYNKITENSNSGTEIGLFIITDPDNYNLSRQLHVCRLIDSAMGKVEILYKNGKNILIQAAQLLDYEQTPSMTITVRCRDPYGLYKQSDFVIHVTDVNERPVFVKLSNTHIRENSGPAVVGILTTQDPDNLNNASRQIIHYSLISNIPSPFVLIGRELSINASLNYESVRSWNIQIRAQDNGVPSLYLDEYIVISVLDVNDKPYAIQLSNNEIMENSDVDTVVGNLVAIDEDVGQSHIYKLLDTAGGRFKIVNNQVKTSLSNTLCLQYGSSLCHLNYELQQSYNISIRVTDKGIPLASHDQLFTIYLNDDNDRPRDLNLNNWEVSANATVGTLIGFLSARDEDSGQSLIYSLVDDDGGRFALNGEKLVTAKFLNNETDQNRVISVAVTDNGYNALKTIRNFTIRVLKVNEVPIAFNFTESIVSSLLENVSVPSEVGTVFVSDSNGKQDFVFTLDDNSNGEFRLNGSSKKCDNFSSLANGTKCSIKLFLVKSLNYERNKRRSVSIRVTDIRGSSLVRTFTIEVIDCNDAPTSISLNGGVSALIMENSAGALVGVLRTTDEDTSQLWSYHLLEDYNLFNVRVSGDEYNIFLNENSSLNYENKSEFNLTVISRDNGQPSFVVSRNFTIFVVDINEAPTQIHLSKHVINETIVLGSEASALTVDDPDNVNNDGQSHSCRVVVGQDKFRIRAGLLLSNVRFNYERIPYVNISVQCVDSGRPRLYITQHFTIFINDVNEEPTDIILSSLVVRENESYVFANISTVDPDNELNNSRQSFTYRLVSTLKDLPFHIEDGKIRTRQALNYEKSSTWNITVESRDSGVPPLKIQRSFIINVQDVNEAPRIITLSPSNVNENPEEWRLIGKLSATDEDENQTHTFTLVDSDSGRFHLVFNSSEIRVAISNTNCLLFGGKYCLLNYEAQSTRVISVRAIDDGIPPLELTMNINITLDDVNDRPRDMTLSKSWIMENAPLNETVGYFNVNDEDTRDILRFSLINSTYGYFKVDANGRLSVNKSTNHEVHEIEHVMVQVVDSGNLSIQQEFTIIIRDSQETPFNITLTSTHGQKSYPMNHARINENSQYGAIVGTLVSYDQDVDQFLSFSLVDSAGGRFSINNLTSCHNLTSVANVNTICSTYLLAVGNLNYESSKSHNVFVEVSDGIHTLVANFTIIVDDENDPPEKVTIQGLAWGRVKENRNTELIGELITSDEDITQSHVYTLKGSEKFILRGNKLFTSAEANIDFEKLQTVDIVVISRDNGIPSKHVKQNITIIIDDVNETPSNISLSASTVKENSEQGTFVANISVDDPDNHGPKGIWQTHNCFLIDSAQDRFRILNNMNTLVVSSGDLNYETSTLHTIIVECRDSARKPLRIQKSFDIEVVDVNERPQKIILSNARVPENAGSLLVGVLSTLDQDRNQSFSYILLSVGAQDSFYVNGTQLWTKVNLDYEKRSTWNIRMETVDQGGLNFSQAVTIFVEDVNDPPRNISSMQPLFVNENSNVGSVITVFYADDEDAGQTHRFFITNITAFRHDMTRIYSYQNALLLNPTSGKLTVDSHINYESMTKIYLGIETRDNGYPSLSFKKDFVVNVVDINEPPSDLKLSNNQISENSDEGSLVGILNVTDPDNINEEKQFYSCQVLNDVPFNVTQMHLIVARDVLDYENIADYTVKINCSELTNPSFSISKSFSVQITDVNEAPFNLVLNGSSVMENLPPNTRIGSLSALDPDQNNVMFTFAEGTSDSLKFSIKESTLMTRAVFDYEQQDSYVINVVAKDDGIPSVNETKEFVIKIIDSNDEPSHIILNSSGIREDAIVGTIVGRLKTHDQDVNQTHFYSLLNLNSTFFIVGNEILVKETNRLDYESAAEMRVLVETTDNGIPSLSHQNDVIINVIDVNERPYAIRNTGSLSVKENSQNDTSVVFEVFDQDYNQSHRCYIYNSNIFEINNSAGEFILRVKYGAVVDFEKNPITAVNVTCTDNGSPPLSSSASFNINIEDVNEPPVDISLNGSYEVDEIAYVNYSLGNLICKDFDRNQTCSFLVVGQYSNTFRVIHGTNLLTVISNVELDYEKLPHPYIMVTIQANDDGVPVQSMLKQLKITVNEINEGANKIYLKAGDVTLRETTEINTNISEVLCNNPERWQTLEYTILSDAATFFKIVKVPYNVTYAPPILNAIGKKQARFELFRSYLFLKKHLMNFDARSSYDLLVEVKDNGHPVKSFIGVIYINVSRVDPCAPTNRCSENAVCHRQDGFNYNCRCMDGYTGDGYNCTDIDDCQPSFDYCDEVQEYPCLPCKHNGKCHDQLKTFNCTCLPGYNGAQCNHNIDECDPRNKFPYSCHKDHGLCIDHINNITCNCHRGYDGWLCQTDIDDCIGEPCGQHPCTDHIGFYECHCEKGYMGSRCERQVGKHECLKDQTYIPYRTDHSEDEDSKDSDKKRNENVCFSGQNITMLHLNKTLLEMYGVSFENYEAFSSAIKIEVEDWIKKRLLVYFSYTNHYTKDGYFNVSDVSVLNPIVNSENISLPIIARVGMKALSQTAILCSLHQFLNCTERAGYTSYTSKDFSYMDFMCVSDEDVKKLHCQTREETLDGLTGKGSKKGGLQRWFIYLLATVGAILFLFVLWFAHYAHSSHKQNLQKALRNGQQFDHMRQPEEHYRDVMLRHHISTIGGESNPIYGLDEDESVMVPNPLYGVSRGIETPITKRGPSFANPLFATREQEDSLSSKSAGQPEPSHDN